jgi:hypothetical protein
VRALLVVGVAVLAVGCSRDQDRPPAGALVEAAKRGDVRAVRALLERGADVNERDPVGRTAVTAAVYTGSIETVRALVDARADVDLQDDMRANAFLALGETGQVEMLDVVVRGDPDVTRTNRFGGTALIPAADRGHVDMVRALLEQTEVDVDNVNDLGWTALLEAVLLGDGGPRHQEIVRLLLDAGANAALADREGVTPAEHARRLGHAEIAALLASTP